MANKTALIAGASGLVGSHLLPLLCRDYDQVAAFTRRPLPFSAPNLREFPLTELSSPGNADAAFCCLGTTQAKAGSEAAFRAVDFTLAFDFAKAARQQGAKRFGLVSSVAASSKSPVLYLRVKGELEDAVSALGFEGLYIAQPSYLAGEREESRTGENIGVAIGRLLSPLLIGPFSKYRTIDAEIVASALLRAVAQGKPGIHRLAYRELAAK